MKSTPAASKAGVYMTKAAGIRTRDCGKSDQNTETSVISTDCLFLALSRYAG